MSSASVSLNQHSGKGKFIYVRISYAPALYGEMLMILFAYISWGLASVYTCEIWIYCMRLYKCLWGLITCLWQCLRGVCGACLFKGMHHKWNETRRNHKSPTTRTYTTHLWVFFFRLCVVDPAGILFIHAHLIKTGIYMPISSEGHIYFLSK